MALYQSCRNLWDQVNFINVPVGYYIETDCVHWVARFGTDIRKLDPTELPVPGMEIINVQSTIEDSEVIVVEDVSKPVARKSVKVTTPVTEETPEA